jgi:hypothetical protein
MGYHVLAVVSVLSSITLCLIRSEKSSYNRVIAIVDHAPAIMAEISHSEADPTISMSPNFIGIMMLVMTSSKEGA